MKYIFLTLLIFLNCNCTNKKDNSAFGQSGSRDINKNLITLVPPMRRGECNFENIVDRTEYLPLYTNDSVLISRISDIKATEERLFVADYKESKLFIFDRMGNFLGLIDHIGEGPEQYKRLCSFDIDPKLKKVYLLDGDMGKVFIYDYYTMALNEIIYLPYKNVDHIKLFKDTSFLMEFGFREFSKNKKKSPNWVRYDFRKKETSDSFFYFLNGDIAYRGRNQVAFSTYENKLFYWTALGDRVYLYDTNGLYEFMRLDFGEYSIPEEVYRLNYSNALLEMRNKHYARLERFYELDKWYYASIARADMSAHFFYNKEHNRSFIDLSFMMVKKGDFITPELFKISEQVMCGYISPEQYLNIIGESQINIKLEDNPILVFYTLK